MYLAFAQLSVRAFGWRRRRASAKSSVLRCLAVQSCPRQKHVLTPLVGSNVRLKESRLSECFPPCRTRKQAESVPIMNQVNGAIRRTKHNGKIDRVRGAGCRMAPRQIAQRATRIGVVLSAGVGRWCE